MAGPDDIRNPDLAPFTGAGLPGVLPGVVPRGPAQMPQGRKDMSIEDMQYENAKRMYELSLKLPGALEADREAMMKRRQAAVGQGFAMDAKYRQAANAPLPPNYDPQYKDVPTTPPRFHQGDPATAIVQPLALLAAIGGLFARRAGTATIRAMTGAMHGQKDANQRNYENYIKEFDEQLKSAKEYNDAEHRKYADAWENRSKTLNERTALLQMLSTQYGNKAMAAAIGSGSAEMIQAQIGAMEGISKALDNMQKAHGKGAGSPGNQMDHLKAEAARLSASQDPAERKKGEDLTVAIRHQSPAMNVEERKDLEGQKQTGREQLKAADWKNKIEAQEREIAYKDRRGEKTDQLKRDLETTKEAAKAEERREKHENKLSEDEANWDKRLEQTQKKIEAAQRRGEDTDSLKREMAADQKEARESLAQQRHDYKMEETEFQWDQRLQQQERDIAFKERRGEKTDDLKEKLEADRIQAQKDIDTVRGERQAQRDERQQGFHETNLEIQHKNRMEEIAKRMEKQGLFGGMRKPDSDTYARALDLKKQHPDWTDEALIMQATRDHLEMEGKTGAGQFSLALQNQVLNGWGEDQWKGIKDRNFRMDLPNRRRLENSADTMVYAEKAADFVKTNPRSMGVLAQTMNTLRIEQLIQGKLRSAQTYGQDNAADAAAANAVAAEAVQKIETDGMKMVGQHLPTGETITLSDATNAITLFKILSQLALSDAAALSTNGQGGTVYLDRRFTDIYSQATSPEAMMTLIANRQEDVNVLWKEKLDLDWHKRKDQDQRPFFANSGSDQTGVIRADPYYMEGVRFNLYSDKKGPEMLRALSKDKMASPAVKAALVLRDARPTKEALMGYLQEQQAALADGKISKEEFALVKEAVRIVAQNVYGAK